MVTCKVNSVVFCGLGKNVNISKYEQKISFAFTSRSPVVIYPAEQKLDEDQDRNDDITSRGMSKKLYSKN